MPSITRPQGTQTPTINVRLINRPIGGLTRGESGLIWGGTMGTHLHSADLGVFLALSMFAYWVIVGGSAVIGNATTDFSF